MTQKTSFVTPAKKPPFVTEAKSPEQRRKDKDDRQKRNVELASKPYARVMEVSTPYSDIIFQIHRQMDLAWKHLKSRSGEPTGLSYEELMQISLELQRHVVEFHELTKKMARLAKWTYKTPFQMQEILNKMKMISAAQATETGTASAVPATPEKIHTLQTNHPTASAQKPGKEKKAAASK